MDNKVNFNVLELVSAISKKARFSQLKQSNLKGIKIKLNQLNKYLHTTERESLLFVCIFSLKFESFHNVDLDAIADYFDCVPLEMLQNKKELQQLQEKLLITIEKETFTRSRMLRREDSEGCCFSVNPIVEQSILENTSVPNVIDRTLEVTNISFVTLISDTIEKNLASKTSHEFFQNILSAKEIEDNYHTLEIVKETKGMLDLLEDRLLFYSICNAYQYSQGDISFQRVINCIFFNQEDKIYVVKKCREKTHPLLKNEIIRFIKKHDMADSYLILDNKGIDIYLDEYSKLFPRKKQGRKQESKQKSIVLSESITEKTLFFEPELKKQLNFLNSTLEETSFKKLRSRLEKEKFSQSVCALFYGSPGTGKTETVYQLAKATGRSIMHVDISQIKGCWYGESEKNIKQVFQDYIEICNECDIKPILLFNEADAIFSKRKENYRSSHDQTENAMQNIILEEMEKLDGILIATTNLAGNLDAAFERRFLFKIKFEKPTVEAKTNIWKSKMSILSKKNAIILAKSYDFSGGEIDNIVRKSIMNEVISGKKATLKDIETLCEQEHIHKQSEGNRIGFGV